jgi:TnpA family transposase
MRTLQVGDNPTRLAQAIAEFGRIDKTLHTLNMIDDENKRRITLTQLNRGEGRHSLGRAIFHGKRGELRQRYREGQEDQLGALGLVVNMIVLWNTIYMEAVLNQLRLEGHQRMPLAANFNERAMRFMVADGSPAKYSLQVETGPGISTAQPTM